MNNRYIDFVPVKKGEAGAVKARVSSTPRVSSSPRVNNTSRTTKVPRVSRVSKTSRVSKATKVVPVDLGSPETKRAYAPIQAPSNRFIKNPRIAKRPLSNTGYKKEVSAQDEKPKGPVTIIDKSEKKSKLGLIVTIIITIVLGAAVGTVAFLLLPK